MRPWGQAVGRFRFLSSDRRQNRCVGTQAPCSHRSSSQTRANSPTRIGDPSERDLQARYTGRFCVFQNVDTAPKSSQSVGHACRRSDFCGPHETSFFVVVFPVPGGPSPMVGNHWAWMIESRRLAASMTARFWLPFRVQPRSEASASGDIYWNSFFLTL